LNSGGSVAPARAVGDPPRPPRPDGTVNGTTPSFSARSPPAPVCALALLLAASDGGRRPSAYAISRSLVEDGVMTRSRSSRQSPFGVVR